MSGRLKSGLHPMVKDDGQTLAHIIEDTLPKGACFALLIFSDGHMNYISNAEREGIVQVMRDFIAMNANA